jgi:hypothetical protein
MREIIVDIERSRLRIVVKYREDELIIKLDPKVARKLAEDLTKAIEDFEQRQHLRID